MKNASKAEIASQARREDGEQTGSGIFGRVGGEGALDYPSTVELADGALYTVWYERLRTSPRAVLRAARWKLSA